MESKWKSMDLAPKDGRLIVLCRKDGSQYKASWREIDSLFRTGKQWVNEDDKFIDIRINPVIGWTAI